MTASAERARLLDDLLVEVALTYHRVQAEADRLAGAGLSAGKLGILRTLSEQGPSTVPAIARSGPVARQGVQKNADALEAAGLVEYAENPRHRRSRLLRATRRGERAYHRAQQARLAWAAWIDDGAVADRGLHGALTTLRWCRRRLLEAGLSS